MSWPFPWTSPTTHGALNFHSTIPHAFTPTAVTLATRFAADSASALRHAARTVEPTGGMQDLAEAFQSRTAIDIAIGLLMARYTCTGEQALRLLITAATERSLSVHDIADGILTRHVQGDHCRRRHGPVAGQDLVHRGGGMAVQTQSAAE